MLGHYMQDGVHWQTHEPFLNDQTPFRSCSSLYSFGGSGGWGSLPSGISEHSLMPSVVWARD